MQENKVVDFASQQFNPYERSYPTHDLELTAMILQ